MGCHAAMGTADRTFAPGGRPDDFEASISVLAERGTAVLSGIACNELATWTLEPGRLAEYSEEFPNAYGLGHKPLLDDVVADLLDGITHPVSFAEGSRAVRLLNAIYRSAEDGLPVRLSDRPESAQLGRDDPALQALYVRLPRATVPK